MKVQDYILPNTLAVTMAIVYVLCRVLIALFPKLSLAIAASWFHTIEVRPVSAMNLTTSSFFLGLISSAIAAWVVGYIFVMVRSWLAK